MNPKRQVIEQAIRDLELHKEDLKMVYNSWLSDELEDHRQTMEDLYDERVKITNNLFTGQTPVLKPEDFRSNRGKKPLRYPLIIGKATKRIVRVPRLISRIDLFIRQLKRKMKTRKDLQESSPFQLTEAKLKQMILEALKDSSFRSFGTPTPDEKLRSQLGDSNFDKIQGFDPEQAEVMKQSYDPNYPEKIRQESLTEMIEAAGFKLYDVSKYTKAPTMHARYNNRIWERGDQNTVGSSSIKVQYNVNDDFLRYSVRLFTKAKSGSKTSKSIADGRVSIPPMFELSLKTEQDLRAADAIMLSTEKQAIEEALEQYK
tara:strand:+ start:8832 stop:9779 length:948 start_codon:yes stop_codon:yes gene_type:complete